MTDKQLDEMSLDELKQHAERLSAESVGGDADIADAIEVDQETATPDPDANVEEQEQGETLEQLKARLDSAEKALKDTKAWGTRKAQEAAELRRAQEEALRAAAKPQILDANPELADAIRYVQTDDSLTFQQRQEQRQQLWQDTVRAAVPDIDDLLADDSFMASLQERAQGVDWSDPIIAVREINAEIRARTVAQAAQAAQAAKAAQRRSASTVPTSGSRQEISPKSADDELLHKIKTMSKEEFAREVRRVSLGY